MIISLLVLVIVIALLLWIIGQIPMDPRVKNVIYVVVVVLLALYVITRFLPALDLP